MEPGAVWAHDIHIVIPVHATPHDVERFRFPEHRVIDARAGLLAFELPPKFLIVEISLSVAVPIVRS